jgi:hypothetical protein
MSSLRKKVNQNLSIICLDAKFFRVLRYAALALGVFLISGIACVSETRTAGAQDIGRMFGGAIQNGLRVPSRREPRHRTNRRNKEDDEDSKDSKTDKNTKDGNSKSFGDKGDGNSKSFGDKGDGNTKVETTKVGDGGSGSNKGQGSGSGGADKAPPPSDKPRGEAPDFSPR